MTKQNKGVREKIICTAERLFAERGYDASGIDLIAREAGITKSLIYYYFKNKGEILAAIFRHLIDESVNFKRRVAGKLEDDPRRNIGQALPFSFQFFDEYQPLIKILMMEALKQNTDTNLFEYFDANLQAGLKLVEQYLGREIEDPNTYIMSHFFLLLWPMMSFSIFQEQWSAFYQIPLSEVRTKFMHLYQEYYRTLYDAYVKNKK
jgi:AcrR family transcriptional regulator